MGRRSGKSVSHVVPVRQRRQRTSDADEYEPSVAEDEMESSPSFSVSKTRACKRTRFGATDEPKVYSLRRETMVNETPASSSVMVVTEESSLSDSSTSHHFGTYQNRRMGKPLAHKRRAGIKHVKPKRMAGICVERSMAEPSMDQPTMANESDQGATRKRTRIATNFYTPAIKRHTWNRMTNQNRPRRDRVATAFFSPTGEHAVGEEELDQLCSSLHEPTFEKTVTITRATKRLVDSRSRHQTLVSKPHLPPRQKRVAAPAVPNIKPARKVVPSTGEAKVAKDKRVKAIDPLPHTTRTRQSRHDSFDAVHSETSESRIVCAPARRALFEEPLEPCRFPGSTPMSHLPLVYQYNELVRQGQCDSVSLGQTLAATQAAIDQKIMALMEKRPDEIEDAEITADHREFKRSLRTFVAFEAQEKLAIVHERQEYEEGIQMPALKVAKSSTLDKVELSKLVDRPIVLSTTSRMSSRKNACPEGPQCRLCGKNVQCVIPSAPKHMLTPFMRPFDIHAAEDEPVEPPRGRRSIVTRHGKQQDTAKATIMALSEMKHSIDFVAEYNQAAGVL